MMKELRCRHYKGDGYGYDINEKETLELCYQCNLTLAEKIMKQLVDEVFIDTIARNMMKNEN